MKLRRTLALLLSLLLLTGSVCTGFADSDAKEMDTDLLDAMEYSASDWMETSTTREFLATLVIVELILTDNTDEDISDIISSALVNDDCYVATSGAGLVLTVLFFGDDKVILATYTPLTKTGQWVIFEGSSSPALLMAGMKSDDTIDDYYSVDSSDVVDLLAEVSEALND